MKQFKLTTIAIVSSASLATGATISFGNQNKVEGDTFETIMQEGFTVSATGPVIYDDTQNNGFMGSSASAVILGQQGVQSLSLVRMDMMAFALETVELAVDGNDMALNPITIQGTDAMGTFTETIDSPSMMSAGTMLQNTRFGNITEAIFFSGAADGTTGLASFITGDATGEMAGGDGGGTTGGGDGGTMGGTMGGDGGTMGGGDGTMGGGDGTMGGTGGMTGGGMGSGGTIPEPSSTLLLGLCCGLGLVVRQRKSA